MKNKIKSCLSHISHLVNNPKYYFTKIIADGDMDGAMLKAFMYGMLGGMSVLAIKLIGGATITLSSVFSAIIMVPVLAVTLLFIIGGLLMLVSEITGGERDWEIAIKGLASVFFIYPIILIINSFAFNCISLWIISLLVDAYILFLFYNISLYCMKGKKSNVMIVIGVIALFILTIYATDYRTGWFMLKNTSATLSCLI